MAALLALAAGSILSSSELAAQRISATAAPLTVVELYTSLACSTCPPADRVLAELAAREDVLALSFHVDYWDYTGWADPFGHDDHTQRQERYLTKLEIPYMITPQMVVNGTLEGVGSDRSSIDKLIRQAAVEMMNYVDIGITRTATREVRVTLPRMEYAGNAEVILVRYDDFHETHVEGGDNRGKRLANVNVVRQLKVHSLWKGEPLDFDLPLERLGDGGDDSDLQFFAVIVQEADQGHILGAKFINLRSNI